MQFFDTNGNPLAGGKVYTYAAGTTTPLATYTDRVGGTANTNPVILDSRGEADIWFSNTGLYLVTLKTALDVLVYTVDNMGGLANATNILFTPHGNLTSTDIQAALAEEVDDLAAPSGASLVGYLPAGTGAVATTAQAKLRESVSVLDYGADPTGVIDSTAAFNLATLAALASTGNDQLALRRDIIVPAGDYLIGGTVYVRLGQRLRGQGQGSSRILIPGTNNGADAFRMGYGIPGGVVTQDLGGLPCVISDLNTYGGDTTGSVIHASAVGQIVHDLFMTSCGTGLRIDGSDGLYSNIIIDQCLNGITLTGQNNLVSNALIYLANYGISVFANSYDIKILNCHFEYSVYNDIVFPAANSDIKDVMITDCQFVKNAQHATLGGAISFRGDGIDATIRGCNFRNERGESIVNGAGLASNIRVSDCVFDGSKTTPAYAQSTTAAGILVGNGNMEISNCKFINLRAAPIAVSFVGAYSVMIKGCTWESITGATSFAALTGTSGTAYIYDCIGDEILPLINMQSAVTVVLRGNKRWLGAIATASSRYYVKIPVQNGAIVKVGIKANTAPAGNNNYTTALTAMAMRRAGYSGGLTDYATLTIAFSAGADGYAPAITPQIDFDAVGSGATLAWSATGRYMVVSVPDTYAAVNFEADFEI